MTEVSRRGFLKLSGTAAGAAAVSGSGAASLTSVVKTTNKIKPVKKLSTYAKAYRQFLSGSIVKTGVNRLSEMPFGTKSVSWKAKMLKDVARTAFAEATVGGQKSTKPIETPALNRLRDAVVESWSGSYPAAQKVSKADKAQVKSLIVDNAELDLKAELRKASPEKYDPADRFPKNRKPSTERLLLKLPEPQKPKTTKRQLFQKAFRKLKGAIRGGFGGPRSGKIGIGSGPPGFQDPSRVSGYHY